MIDWLLQPFQYEFMFNALAVVIASGLATAMLSCWLVLIGWSLMGDAVSHAVLPGIVLASLGGVPFVVGALAFALLAVWLISVVRDHSVVKEDAAIGVVFTSLFALGMVLISFFPTKQHMDHILFGDILGTSTSTLLQIVAISILVVGTLSLKRHDLTLFAFDRVGAHSLGISTRFLSALLLVNLALAAVAGLQSVGVILVIAMLIIPGATAHLLCGTMNRMLVVASISAIASGVVGIYTSFYADLPPGPIIVLVQALFFTLAYLFSYRSGLVTRRLLHRTKAP